MESCSISMFCKRNEAPLCTQLDIPRRSTLVYGNDCKDRYTYIIYLLMATHHSSQHLMSFICSTQGARLTAGLSCLLGCALNNCTSSAGASDHVKSNNNRLSQLELCEAECNNRFMTMKPIDTRWLNTSIRACRV